MRFEPMTKDRGRTWGVWDSSLSAWVTEPDRFSREDDAEVAAEKLNWECEPQ